jgi:hypothetical protein
VTGEMMVRNLRTGTRGVNRRTRVFMWVIYS